MLPLKCAAYDKSVCLADRNSMMGVKSMVTSAGSPGMSGMMEVSPSRIHVPATETNQLKLQQLKLVRS